MRQGSLRVQELVFELPEGAKAGEVTVLKSGGEASGRAHVYREVAGAEAAQEGLALKVRLAEALTLAEGEALGLKIALE